MNLSCVTRFFGRTYVKIKPGLPTASVILGIGLITWGTIDACIKTAKDAEPVLDNHQAMIDQIAEKERAEEKRRSLDPEGVPTYSDEQKTHDTLAAYSTTTRGMIKVYSGPAIKFILGVAGVAVGFGMQRAMYVGAVAVGKKISDDFNAYRGRVRAAEGTEADLRYLHGTTTETVVETVTDPETGEEKTVVTEVEKYDTSNLPLYTAVFDELNPNFDPRNPIGNKIFIGAVMNDLTQDLITYGFVTYNTARIRCGYEPVLEGNRVGWIYDEKNPAGDNRVIITMLDEEAAKGKYMSGKLHAAPPTLITFNCDGDIEELMKERGRWPSIFHKAG